MRVVGSDVGRSVGRNVGEPVTIARIVAEFGDDDEAASAAIVAAAFTPTAAGVAMPSAAADAVTAASKGVEEDAEGEKAAERSASIRASTTAGSVWKVTMSRSKMI